MNMIQDIQLSLWLIPPALFLILLVPFIILSRRILFSGKLKKVSLGRLGEEKLKEKELLRYYKLVEKKLNDPESRLYKKKIIGDIWVKKLLSGGGKHWFNLIVKYFPQEYLFACFLQGLKKRSLFHLIRDFLDQDDVIMNLEALGKSCASQSFDGRRAAQMLEDKKHEIGNLTGSALGDVRFFAYSILIYFDDSLSGQTVMRGFSDSHKPVRMLLVEKVQFGSREEAYGKLKEILLTDPSQSVRTMAGRRINEKYNDLKDFDVSQLNRDQILHLISLMSLESDRDEKTAIALLESEDKALLYEAASYLNKKGVLTRFLKELYPGDSYDFNRKVHLLGLAASVNVTAFFNDKDSWEREGSLLGAARILRGRGDLKWLEWLAQKVFPRNPYGTDFSLELYRATLEAIDETGSDRCHQLKAQELKKHQDDPLIMEALLSAIPVQREFFYMDDLFFLLENGQTFCQLLVRERLVKYAPSLILTHLYDQLLNESNSRELRAHALLIMAELHLDYTLHLILENLPVLDDEDLLILPEILALFPQETLKELCDQLFDSCDGDIHRTLIMVLPEKLAGEYTEILFGFLANRDWRIRKVSLEKLKKISLLSPQDGLSLLNDPHEEVRKASAIALLDENDGNILEVVGELLTSSSEVPSVKKSIITGLFLSSEKEALLMLFTYLDRSDEFKPLILELLSTRNDRFYLETLIEYYRVASPSVRSDLTPSLIALGTSMEKGLLELLSDQTSRSREIIVQLLKEGGFIGRIISHLNSPHSEERIKTVKMLVYLNDKDSLRAAVMAVSDPVNQVRVAVVRALEKLDTPGRKLLLNELKEDPDKKVRQYAQWAIERLKAKTK